MEDSSTIHLADPSPLTTAQVQREVASLEKLLEQRIDSIEQAVKVAHENLVRVPTDVDKAIGHLRETIEGKFDTVRQAFLIHLEKFASVQTQFQERDVRTEQTAKDSKVAVDAALQAAKEAVGKQQEASDRAIAKQEAATNKQLDQVVTLIAANFKALDDKNSDLKDRVGTIEAKSTGLKDGWGYLVGVLSLLAALITVGVLVSSKNAASLQAATPQVIYVPAPIAAPAAPVQVKP